MAVMASTSQLTLRPIASVKPSTQRMKRSIGASPTPKNAPASIHKGPRDKPSLEGLGDDAEEHQGAKQVVAAEGGKAGVEVLVANAPELPQGLGARRGEARIIGPIELVAEPGLHQACPCAQESQGDGRPIKATEEPRRGLDAHGFVPWPVHHGVFRVVGEGP